MLVIYLVKLLEEHITVNQFHIYFHMFHCENYYSIIYTEHLINYYYIEVYYLQYMSKV